jgi:hypothetical protein
MGGRTVYNLGFGDFDEALDTIVDDVNNLSSIIIEI